MVSCLSCNMLPTEHNVLSDLFLALHHVAPCSFLSDQPIARGSIPFVPPLFPLPHPLPPNRLTHATVLLIAQAVKAGDVQTFERELDKNMYIFCAQVRLMCQVTRTESC